MTLADIVFSLVHAAVAGVLVAVILFDLRQMRIPNRLSLILIGAFVVLALLGGPMPDFWARLAVAGVVFALGFAAFAANVMGGGDVKILAALALFVPLAQLQGVMLILSLALVIGTIAVVLLRRVITAPEGTGWAFLETRRMPMGLPIGMAGLSALALAGLAG